MMLAADGTVIATMFDGQPGACPGVIGTLRNSAIDLSSLGIGRHTLYVARGQAANIDQAVAQYEAAPSRRIAIGTITQ